MILFNAYFQRLETVLAETKTAKEALAPWQHRHIWQIEHLDVDVTWLFAS